MYTYSGKMEEHRGVYALLLTPFKDDKSVDFEALKAYTEWQVEQQPHHLFPVCGSSEMMSLNLDERLEIARTVAAHSGKLPVVATANLCQGTHEEQIDEVKKMSDTGVSGLVFVTKGLEKDQAQMYDYMTDLAQYTDLPIVIYEFPGFPNNKISGETYGKLVETGKFVAIKDTTCTMEKIQEKIDRQGESAVLQANIPLLFKAYEAGARGVVATPSTCGAYMLRKMYDAYFVEQDTEKARKIHQVVDMFAEVVDGNFTSSAKYMVNLCGVKMNTIKRDGGDLNEQKKESLQVLRDFAISQGLMK